MMKLRRSLARSAHPPSLRSHHTTQHSLRPRSTSETSDCVYGIPFPPDRKLTPAVESHCSGLDAPDPRVFGFLDEALCAGFFSLGDELSLLPLPFDSRDLAFRPPFFEFESSEDSLSSPTTFKAVRSGHDCTAASAAAARFGSECTFANRPLMRGRLSASVFRHSYRIFLCPRCLASRFARYRCSCACLSALVANGLVKTWS